VHVPAPFAVAPSSSNTTSCSIDATSTVAPFIAHWPVCSSSTTLDCLSSATGSFQL
jgi:hypothetical protein